jgi:hypothetical protein
MQDSEKRAIGFEMPYLLPTCRQAVVCKNSHEADNIDDSDKYSSQSSIAGHASLPARLSEIF